MTPGARLQTAIELLAEIDAGKRPADVILNTAYRRRRYMGAKDRRAVTERIYGVLRRRARLDWHLAQAAPLPRPPEARARMIADLTLHDGLAAAEIAALFAGPPYRPPPLDDPERTLAKALENRPLETLEMPRWAALEMPDWLAESFTRALGPALEETLRALNEPAPTDLRVNTLKATRSEARDLLAADGVKTAPTPRSPLGLRVAGRPRLPGTRAFREGLVEMQDEGSQLLARLVEATPGMTVVDLCAGGGGKTLALAADMANRGQIWACDIDAKRLEAMTSRQRRAGIGIVQRHRLEGSIDPGLASLAGQAQRVMVDAPCTGTGTWRRAPDAKWRLTARELERCLETQSGLLDQAARLVAPGGRLVYATCSLLAEENEDRIESFLTHASGFAPLTVANIWPRVADGPCPAQGPYLRLDPATTDTDGFFCAVLERRARR